MRGMLVDVFERESAVSAELERLGYAVQVRRLTVGDYVVATRAIVERKTVADLHRSVLTGRLWRQLARLRATRLAPYLLVEGTRLDSGPLSARAVRAALLATHEHGVGVLVARDARGSARWLDALACRRPAGRAHRVNPRRAPGVAPAELALCQVPGISIVSARALLAVFGTLAEIAAATAEELQAAVGVGRARAAAVERTFHERARSSS